MDYISVLNEEEIKKLCSLIGAENFRKLYQKESREFSKIMPGFRPKKLSDSEAVRLAAKNISRPFIGSFINAKVKIWLEEIQENVTALKSNGINLDEAIVQTLLGCVFSENLAIYFKLAKLDHDIDFAKIVQSAINFISAKNASRDAEDTSMPSDNSNSDELSALKAENARIAAEYEANKDKLQVLRDENDQLLDELSDYRKRAAKADDCGKFIYNSDYPYVSVCQVYHDDRDRLRLKRLADINGEDISESFLDNYPGYQRLYSQSGPSADDYIGIWNWRVIPNANDTDKDYIETIYNEFSMPVEIVKCNCNSISELSSLLVDGLEANLCSGRVLFSFWNNSSARYEALLCTEAELTSSSGRYSLKSNVMQLPVFAFTISDICCLNDHLFYYSLSMGMPLKIYPVRDELEMLKNIILKRAVWSAFKEKGINHNVHNILKGFISDMPLKDLYEEIAETCECSVSHAEELLKEFEEKSGKYITGSDLDSETIRLIVEGNKELHESCKHSILKDWESENHEKLECAAKALDSIRAHVADENTTLKLLQDEYKVVKEKVDSAKVQLNKREQLAADVERKVNERINSAKKNAADFITEFAFSSVLACGNAEKAELINFRPGIFLSEDSLDTNSSWEDEVDTVKYELSEAGVDSKFVNSLSAFLYSAYVSRCPVLLSGPNAQDIADAFSCSLYGRTASRIDLSSEISDDDIANLSSDDAEIIVIEHPFSPEKAVPFINENKFIMAINPYIDDLIIEPNGILNYYIPVFTELFVGSRSGRNFVGGIEGENFSEYIPADADNAATAFPNNIKISRLAENNIRSVLCNTHKISGDLSGDIDYLFGLFPCAYITGQCDALKNYMEEHSCSIEVRNTLTPYMGEFI